jgi:hypothetical protein
MAKIGTPIGPTGTLSLLQECKKWYSYFAKRIGNFLKIEHHTIQNCGPRYIPKELKTYVHTKTCTQMSTGTLFIIAQM